MNTEVLNIWRTEACIPSELEDLLAGHHQSHPHQPLPHQTRPRQLTSGTHRISHGHCNK
jgi:hypothetical protein